MNKIKILLVEDLKIAQKVAIMTLENLNCQVDIADTGTYALELSYHEKYDLIFMDLGLDDIDGLTVTEAIRTTESQNKHTPIVALTAHSASDEEMRKKCFQVGMNDFIEKPIKAALVKTIFNRFNFNY